MQPSGDRRESVMWFVGLLLGGALGWMAGAEFAVAGAIFGTVAGALWSASRSTRQNDRLDRIEEQLTLLTLRLDALESSAAKQASEPAAWTSGQPPPVPTAAERAELAAAVRTLRSAAAEIEEAPPVAAIEREPAAAAGASQLEPVAAEAPAPAAPADHAPTVRAPRDAGATAATPSRLLGWLLGGNTVVRAGVIILFFGVAFLLKYASERVHVPIELRLAGVAFGAAALLLLGWRLRERRTGYALALQGGGVGLLYLVIYAAFRLYALLPPAPTFALLAAVAGLSAALAVLQDARSLAVAGVTGGFLAPVLASTGTGSHVMLFGYYAVLNLGILAIALHKAWRELNLVGFAFTFVVAGLWGGTYYRPDLFASTEPFLVFHFLLYVAVAVLFALREAPRLGHYVDGTLVFGTPLLAFWYQTRLARDFEHGAAWSALALGVFYLVLVPAPTLRARAGLRLLRESFLALGIAFVTLAIPLAFDGRWTSAAWALEGAAIFWVGQRQRRLFPQACGMLLQIGAGVAFLLDPGAPSANVPLLNSAFVGALIVALGALFCAWACNRDEDQADWRPGASGLMLVWGLAWWCGAGLHEIERFAPAHYVNQAGLAFLTATGCTFSVLQRAIRWDQARYVALLVLPVVALATIALWLDRGRPFDRGGWLVWPLALAAHLWLLRRHEPDLGRAATGYHVAGLWVLAVLGVREIDWIVARGFDAPEEWRMIFRALVPALLVGGLARFGDRIAWSVAGQPRAYLLIGPLPFALFLWGWTLATSLLLRGDVAPLPYLPIVNPLELAQVAAMLAVAAWIVRLQTLEALPAILRIGPALHRAAAATAFVWANGVLLRALHHFGGVPFRMEALLRSPLVQTAFSILWTLIALATMVVATRRGMRALWLAGGALMAVVVAKLFFVDLSHLEGVERIVSFIGVGLLMLLVGYLSPVPPRGGSTQNPA